MATSKKKPAKSSAMSPSWKAAPITQPQEYINSVAISQDGKTVIAGTFYFPYGAGAMHSAADATMITVGTFAWNATGNKLWQDEFQATEGVYWVGISRDGKWAASAGRTAPAHGFVYVYNVSTGKRVLTYGTKTRVNMVAFASDGSSLVAGSDDIYLFSRTGSTWGSPQTLAPATGDSIVSVGISSNGQWIVAGTFLGTVMLVKNSSGALGTPVSWTLKNGTIHWVAISADGSTFAAGGSDAAVHCFQTAKFATSRQPAWSGALTGCVSCRAVALSDNGSLVSAVGNKGTAGEVFLFSNKETSGSQLWVQPTTRNPNSTSIDSAGKYVTVADGYPDKTPGDFYLFDSSGTVVGTFQTSNMSWPMQISADGTAIAAGSDDSNVYYFVV